MIFVIFIDYKIDKTKASDTALNDKKRRYGVFNYMEMLLIVA